MMGKGNRLKERKEKQLRRIIALVWAPMLCICIQPLKQTLCVRVLWGGGGELFDISISIFCFSDRTINLPGDQESLETILLMLPSRGHPDYLDNL